VLFQNAFEAALIPFLAGIPSRVGYSTDSRRALLTHPLPVPDWRNRKHEVFYYLNIVEQLEGLLEPRQRNSSAEVNCSISVSETRRAQARKMLQSQIEREGPTIALCPGSINSRAKRWPAERFAQLADRLIEERNANLLLIGSREEMGVAKEVRAHMKHQPIDLIGNTDLAEAVAMVSVADLVVSNDTGPAHIASALGRPTLVIFGPTNPLTTRPYAATAEVIRQPPDCAPCMLRDCPIDHRCMTAISADEVFAKASKLLEVNLTTPIL
jgi:heptosyltransferase-2